MGQLRFDHWKVKEWTYPERTVPATRAKSHAIGADTEAADAVLVASQDADALTLKGVPHVACPVVITAKKDATGDRERDGGDTAKNVVMCERIELTVGTNVKKTARCIVRTRSKGVSIREEAVVLSVAKSISQRCSPLT